MRIVGGRFKGRALKGPSASDAIRPTSDRARESLFNVLAHAYPEALDGTRVLDLFAGTGALGFEALSRGARFALFVDEGVAPRGIIRTNVEALQQTGTTKIFRRDATRLGTVGTMAPFDLVFADPPYSKGLGERALASAAEGGWLADNALVVFEEAASATVQIPDRFAPLDERRYGDTVLRFLRFQPDLRE